MIPRPSKTSKKDWVAAYQSPPQDSANWHMRKLGFTRKSFEESSGSQQIHVFHRGSEVAKMGNIDMAWEFIEAQTLP